MVFVKFLQLLFNCEIDVQVGNGRLNYINGYVSKDHDAVDVGLGEYVQKQATAPWLATYRLLCRSTPGIPEVSLSVVVNGPIPSFVLAWAGGGATLLVLLVLLQV